LSSETVDKFSTWALAGVGAAAALLLNNIDAIANSLSGNGFRYIIFCLAASMICGIFSKYQASMCKVFANVFLNLENEKDHIFTEHKKHEVMIQQRASDLGLEIDSDIRMSKVLDILGEMYPLTQRWFVKLLAKRAKNSEGQTPFLPAASRFIRQAQFIFFQIFFIALSIVLAGWFS